MKRYFFQWKRDISILALEVISWSCWKGLGYHLETVVDEAARPAEQITLVVKAGYVE
jgi:hypothetical protein